MYVCNTQKTCFYHNFTISQCFIFKSSIIFLTLNASPIFQQMICKVIANTSITLYHCFYFIIEIQIGNLERAYTFRY